MNDWAQLHWQHDGMNPVFVCMYMIMQFRSYETRHPRCKDNYIITLVVGEQFFHLTSNQTLQHLERCMNVLTTLSWSLMCTCYFV